MLTQEFKKLNLKAGQRIKITWTPAYEKKQVNQTTYVKEIKETVLTPTKKELCLYNTQNGFLAVSSIENIEILPDIERNTYIVSWKNGKEHETIKGVTFTQALVDYGISRKDVDQWKEIK